MLGGGFLRQMNETMKANRDLLGKQKRKPFDRTEYKEISTSPKKDIWKTDLTEAELQELRAKIRLKKKRERITEIVIAVIVFAGVIFLMFRSAVYFSRF
jgi:hypothetical protein